MTAMTDDGVSVLLSSHQVAELERVADFLIVLSRARLQVAGEVDDLLAGHRLLTGPTAEADEYASRLTVVQTRRGDAQTHLLVRTGDAAAPGAPRLGIPPGQPGGSRDGVSAQPRCQPTRAPHPRSAPAADGGNPMSVLTLPAQPGQDTAPPPVPWRGMAWITWRQQRATLIAVPAVLAAVAVFLVIFGLKAHHDYAALVNCPLDPGQQSNACDKLFSHFNSTDWPLANTSPS